jgi:hypothetical protein
LVSFVKTKFLLILISWHVDSSLSIRVSCKKTSESLARDVGIVHDGDVDLVQMLAFHASDGQLHGLGSEQLVVDVGALKLGFSLLNIVGALGPDSDTLVSGSNVDVLTFLLRHSVGLIKILGLNQIVIAGYLVLELELIDVSIVLKPLLLLKELVV